MENQILVIGLLMLGAFVGGKIARKIGLGEVVGQILGGVFVGPSFLGIIISGLERTGISNTQLLGGAVRFLQIHLCGYEAIFSNFISLPFYSWELLPFRLVRNSIEIA